MIPLEPARAAWLLSLRDVVVGALPDLKESAVDLLLAHAALESGWGTSRAFRRGLNFANLTAGPAWKGAKWVDVGGDKNAAGEPITQTWRCYCTLDEAVRDYWTFLGPVANAGRYLKARGCLEDANAIDFATELHRAGYYELATQEYAHRLGQVLAIVLHTLHP